MNLSTKMAVAMDVTAQNLLALLSQPMPKAIVRVIRGEIRKLERYSDQLAGGR